MPFFWGDMKHGIAEKKSLAWLNDQSWLFMKYWSHRYLLPSFPASFPLPWDCTSQEGVRALSLILF